MKPDIDLLEQTIVNLMNKLLPPRPSHDLRVFIAGFALGLIVSAMYSFLYIEWIRSFLELLTKIH